MNYDSTDVGVEGPLPPTLASNPSCQRVSACPQSLPLATRQTSRSSLSPPITPLAIWPASWAIPQAMLATSWTELLWPTQSPELVRHPMARPCWTQRHCMLVLFQAVIYFSSRAWITEGLRLIPVGINSSFCRGATIRQPPNHRWRPLTFISSSSFLTVFSLVFHYHYW